MFNMNIKRSTQTLNVCHYYDNTLYYRSRERTLFFPVTSVLPRYAFDFDSVHTDSFQSITSTGINFICSTWTLYVLPELSWSNFIWWTWTFYVRHFTTWHCFIPTRPCPATTSFIRYTIQIITGYAPFWMNLVRSTWTLMCYSESLISNMIFNVQPEL